MARQPGYYSSEDTPDEAFFLECGFKPASGNGLELEFHGGVATVYLDGNVRLYLEGMRDNRSVPVRIFPKRDDGYVDCQDIMDLLMLLGVPCSVELH